AAGGRVHHELDLLVQLGQGQRPPLQGPRHAVAHAQLVVHDQDVQRLHGIHSLSSRSISRVSCSTRTGLARMASAFTQLFSSGVVASKSSPVSLCTAETRITGIVGSSFLMW